MRVFLTSEGCCHPTQFLVLAHDEEEVKFLLREHYSQWYDVDDYMPDVGTIKELDVVLDASETSRIVSSV